MEPRRLNTYRTSFSAACPTNGVLITYDLTIKVETMIVVEALQEFLWGIKQGYHEDIADSLWLKFGGHQTMTAHHHGVEINTERSPSKQLQQWLDQSLPGMAGIPGY